MKHSDIIKGINKTFLEDWPGVLPVHLDSTEVKTTKEPYISLRYQPHRTKNKFLTNDIRGLQIHGTVRVLIYQTNPTTSMITMDEVLDFLRNKTHNDILFTELEMLGAPFVQENGDLYVSFVDFDTCLNH